MKLDEKHRIEKDFHDNWAKTIVLEKVNYLQAFEAVTALENRFALSLMKPLAGKRILDVGCGMGDATVYFGLKNAFVEAIDISPGMIRVVKKLIKKYKLSRYIQAKVMVAERLEYPKESFDFVFGNGLLHHVEPKMALKEVYRVLKPGGKALFVEPLAHNFFINIYRKIASDVRTPTERPFCYEELNHLIKVRFKKIYHKEFHLFTLLIFIWFYLIERVNPNKERYWKKIIDDGERIRWGFNILNFLDKMLLASAPFLRKYCWNTVLVLEKGV